MESKHTSTPWFVFIDDDMSKKSLSVRDKNDAVICLLKAAHGNKLDNAAFIVRACNAHQDLVHACQRVSSAEKRLRAICKEAAAPEWAMNAWDEISSLAATCNAALDTTKARGEV